MMDDYPTNISRYELIRKIGRGGYGSVFEAKILQTNFTSYLSPSRTSSDKNLTPVNVAIKRVLHLSYITR